MSDEIREQLSALMDGELPRDQVRFLLRRIDGDTQLAQTWMRYHLAGNVLRVHRAATPLRDDFADVLMQRIGAGSAGLGMRLLRWAGGGAIAAAVAVFALVSTRPNVGTEPSGALAAAPVAAVPAETIVRNAMPQLPLQPAFDFTQPASFDKDGGVISLPTYRREQPIALEPYILLIAQPQTADSSSQH